jgi:hypothetical protein
MGEPLPSKNNPRILFAGNRNAASFYQLVISSTAILSSGNDKMAITIGTLYQKLSIIIIVKNLIKVLPILVLIRAKKGFIYAIRYQAN